MPIQDAETGSTDMSTFPDDHTHAHEPYFGTCRYFPDSSALTLTQARPTAGFDCSRLRSNLSGGFESVRVTPEALSSSSTHCQLRFHGIYSGTHATLLCSPA